MKTKKVIFVQIFLPAILFTILFFLDLFVLKINSRSDFLIYTCVIVLLTLMTVSNSKNNEFNSTENYYKYSYFLMTLVFGLLCCSYIIKHFNSAILGLMIFYSGINIILFYLEFASDNTLRDSLRASIYLKKVLICFGLIFLIIGSYMMAIGTWDWPFKFPHI